MIVETTLQSIFFFLIESTEASFFSVSARMKFGIGRVNSGLFFIYFFFQHAKHGRLMVLHPLLCIAGKGGFPSYGTLAVQCFFPIKKGPISLFWKA